MYVWDAEKCFTSTRMLWFAEAEDSVSYSAFVIHKCGVQHDSRFTMEEVSPKEDHVNGPSDSKVWKRSFLHLLWRVRNSCCEYLVINTEKVLYLVLFQTYLFIIILVKLVWRICILKGHTNVKCGRGRYFFYCIIDLDWLRSFF